jgi:hypothetical protein
LLKRAHGLRTQTVRLQVRLTLAHDAVPGSIAFPLTVFAAPN